MKVLLVNTSERSGGAAIAALRLLDALNKHSAQAQMLVMWKQTERTDVLTLPRPSWLRKAAAYAERLTVFCANFFSRRQLFQLSPAIAGFDITSLPAFKEADVIHIHWINHGFLSLNNLQKVIASGKPVIWTMHDAWTFSALRHVHFQGDETRTNLPQCPERYSAPTMQWLANIVYKQKEKLYSKANRICFVGCSQWITQLASHSFLLRHNRVTQIFNPINTDFYAPQDNLLARQQFNLPKERLLLLFVAFRVTDEHKGFGKLCEALDIIARESPQLHEQLGVILVGRDAQTAKTQLNVPAYAFDYVSDEREMTQLYNAADTFVIPTRFDNLPNTVAEAMACGKPVVGFRVGGLPEMVDHLENGYLAEPQSAEDLARGIVCTFDAYAYPGLARLARKKALTAFSEQRVAQQTIDLYQSL